MGTMHSKLQLLFHADRMRVLIPTVPSFVTKYGTKLGKCNLTPTEWGEEPRMLENVAPNPQSEAQLTP